MTREAFLVSGVARTPAADIWWTDPSTLRDVALNREAVQSRLEEAADLERIWLLCLLDRADEAIVEGHQLLAGAADRFRPLLVLAQAYQRRYAWHEAARLHEEALCLAGTPRREAMARYQIGKRLFDEARYRDAAAEFEWARDLFRNTGQTQGPSEAACERALERARELARHAWAENQPVAGSQ